MKDKLGDKVRIQHIYDAILDIESYTQNVEIDEFLNNSMMRFACVKQIEIIGEASNHISADFRARFKEIEWREIVSLRNILVHEYFGIVNRIIWGIIQKDIPDLKVKIENILNQL
jgi:uncharacterized protein with HEPN domain